jgi:hypothetical protein
VALVLIVLIEAIVLRLRVREAEEEIAGLDRVLEMLVGSELRLRAQQPDRVMSGITCDALSPTTESLVYTHVLFSQTWV